jgi:hypothetical protein
VIKSKSEKPINDLVNYCIVVDAIDRYGVDKISKIFFSNDHQPYLTFYFDRD